MRAIIIILLFTGALTLTACQEKENHMNMDNKEQAEGKQEMKDTQHKFELVKTDEEWKNELTPEEYRVLREKGTERAFTGKFNVHKEEGVYTCAACGNELFSSDSKYDSGSGWPSYFKPISEDAIAEVPDNSHGWNRTEVLCGRCGGHLGHVFNDGPQPTGLRYCVNSVSLDFENKDVDGDGEK